MTKAIEMSMDADVVAWAFEKAAKDYASYIFGGLVPIYLIREIASLGRDEFDSACRELRQHGYRLCPISYATVETLDPIGHDEETALRNKADAIEGMGNETLFYLEKN